MIETTYYYVIKRFDTNLGKIITKESDYQDPSYRTLSPFEIDTIIWIDVDKDNNIYRAYVKDYHTWSFNSGYIYQDYYYGLLTYLEVFTVRRRDEKLKKLGI